MLISLRPVPTALTVAVLIIIEYLCSSYVSSRLQAQFYDLKTEYDYTNNYQNEEIFSKKNQLLFFFYSGWVHYVKRGIAKRIRCWIESFIRISGRGSFLLPSNSLRFIDLSRDKNRSELFCSLKRITLLFITAFFYRWKNNSPPKIRVDHDEWANISFVF